MSRFLRIWPWEEWKFLLPHFLHPSSTPMVIVYLLLGFGCGVGLTFSHLYFLSCPESLPIIKFCLLFGLAVIFESRVNHYPPLVDACVICCWITETLAILSF